jgi:hypothetical protein
VPTILIPHSLAQWWARHLPRFAHQAASPTLQASTIGKRVAVAGHDAFDHRLLREMQEDAFAQAFGARQRAFRIVERGFDGVGHGADDVRGEQLLASGRGQADAVWANLTIYSSSGLHSHDCFSSENDDEKAIFIHGF